MTYLPIIVVLLMLACAGFMVIVHNWLWFWLGIGIAAGILWLWAAEHRWSQRLRITWLRFVLYHLKRTMDKTTVEMMDAWQEEPGGDRWRALDAWLAELFIERRALVQRIEMLVYKLGLETY